jgi:hypothetical protein
MQDLDKDQTEHVSGALRIKLPPIKKPPVTTMAIGEEGGPIVTSMYVGEEGGPILTTLALGEEGGGGITPVTTTTSALGSF